MILDPFMVLDSSIILSLWIYSSTRIDRWMRNLGGKLKMQKSLIDMNPLIWYSLWHDTAGWTLRRQDRYTETVKLFEIDAPELASAKLSAIDTNFSGYNTHIVDIGSTHDSNFAPGWRKHVATLIVKSKVYNEVRLL